MMKIVATEGITITKAELEEMCEKNGNDIRSILNALQFRNVGHNIGDKKDVSDVAKDAIHRLDLFSATQKLFSNKRCALNQSEEYIYVDYHMVPLMVQEAYGSAATSVEELEAASDLLSHGDLIDQAIWKTQDWSLLPVHVANTAAVARTVKGNAPFHIFPQFLGKNSKRMKHARWMEEMCKPMRCNATTMRLDYVEPLRMSLLQPLLKGDIKSAIAGLDAIGLTRDNLMALCDMAFDPVEIPTKVKTGFTREWNKTRVGGTRHKMITSEKQDDSDMEELDEMEELGLE
jgi:hypothetical protein